MYLMMMTVDAEKLVQWSTTCKRIYLYSASNLLPQFPEMCLTLEGQLLVLVEVFCIFYMWETALRHLFFYQLFVVRPQGTCISNNLE